MPPDLLEKALKAAEAEHRTFSNYVQRLIAADLKTKPDLLADAKNRQAEKLSA